MEDITSKIRNILENKGGYFAPEEYSKLLCLIDYTTLNSADKTSDIRRLCSNAKKLFDELGYSVASICTYPNFANIVSKELKGYDINVTSVAGGFPSSQTVIEIKKAEVKYAIDQGADEIDIVLPRGKFLEGNINQVKDELAELREVSGGKILKVILESGMLETEEQVVLASKMAIESGADFIKTSTGKELVGATLKSHYLMTNEILNHFQKTNRLVGIKPAGGISTPEEALKYTLISEAIINETFIEKNTFRLGASKLLNGLINRIANVQRKPDLLKILN